MFELGSSLQSLESENKDLKQQIQKFKEQVQEFKDNDKTKEKELYDIKLKYEATCLENNRLADKNTQLSEEFRSQQQVIANYEVSQKFYSSQENDKLKAEIYEMKRHAETMQRNLDTTKEEVLDLRTKYKRRNKDYEEISLLLKSSNSVVMQENAKLREHKTILEETVEELRQSWQEASSIQAQNIHSMQSEIEERKAEILDVRETVRNTNIILLKKQKQIKNLTDENHKLKEDKKSILARLTKKESQIAKNVVDVLELQSQVACLEEEFGEDYYEFDEEDFRELENLNIKPLPEFDYDLKEVESPSPVVTNDKNPQKL